METLRGKKIVLGITGSIAAYKACYLIRGLIKRGAEVQVVITPAGKEFITPVTLSALTSKHNICPMETNIPDATDTIQVNRNLHFEQIADVCGINMDEIKSLNPQYKRNIVPGDSKPRTLRLPINYISTFIDSQDTIYAHRSAELFKNRRTVSVANTRSTARSSKGKSSPQGEVTYHKIRSGETLSTIARKYGVTVNQIKNWNGMSSTRINAGKRLKIYK